ncbi:MAG: FixJ family two-component response regulator [Candidatus Latescibacterota bacterium]|jgi:FixJ family two-component response regulator
MPHLSGQDVLPRLRELKPEISIIVLTGYGFGANEFPHATDVLKKPPGMDELTRRIRTALDTL